MTELTPRARAILAAVEQEVEARIDALEREDAPAPHPLRAGPELLAALELGVAGHERAAVADRLRDDHGVSDPEPFLDAVFGAGAAPRARLFRRSR